MDAVQALVPALQFVALACAFQEGSENGENPTNDGSRSAAIARKQRGHLAILLGFRDPETQRVHPFFFLKQAKTLAERGEDAKVLARKPLPVLGLFQISHVVVQKLQEIVESLRRRPEITQEIFTQRIRVDLLGITAGEELEPQLMPLTVLAYAHSRIFYQSGRLFHQLSHGSAFLQIFVGRHLLQHFLQCQSREGHIRQRAMAIERHLQVKALAEHIEGMAEIRGVQTPAEHHRAQALGEIGVAPAELLLRVQEAHVELRIVRDEDRSLRELQELREDNVDGRREFHCCFINFIHLPRVPRNLAFGIHERHKRGLLLKNAILHTHSRDFDDPMAPQCIESRGLDVEDSEGGEVGHRGNIVEVEQRRK